MAPAADAAPPPRVVPASTVQLLTPVPNAAAHP
jgi:hypothetical protein